MKKKTKEEERERESGCGNQPAEKSKDGSAVYCKVTNFRPVPIFVLLT